MTLLPLLKYLLPPLCVDTPALGVLSQEELPQQISGRRLSEREEVLEQRTETGHTPSMAYMLSKSDAQAKTDAGAGAHAMAPPA